MTRVYMCQLGVCSYAFDKLFKNKIIVTLKEPWRYLVDWYNKLNSVTETKS